MARHSGLGDVALGEGEHLALLQVEVLDQGGVEVVEQVGQAVPGAGAGRDRPAGPHPAAVPHQPVDASVLRLHHLDEGQEVHGHPLAEERPDQVVLQLVVVVQATEQEVEVVGDDAGPGGVADLDPPHQGSGEAELAAERGVHDEHRAGVAERGVGPPVRRSAGGIARPGSGSWSSSWGAPVLGAVPTITPSARRRLDARLQELHRLCSSWHDAPVARIDVPQNQRSRDTRAALLDAAWDLLEHSDGRPPTMAAVAEAAGVSRRGLYLHFPTRGQLFIDLMTHVDDALDLEGRCAPCRRRPIRWRPWTPSPTTWPATTRAWSAWSGPSTGVVRATPTSPRCGTGPPAPGTAAVGAWPRPWRPRASLAEPWTPATAADLMWALMSVELVDDLTGDRGWSTDDLADRLRVLLHRTLCGGDGSR